MRTIREDDLVESISDALQFISYYHPADYIEHLSRAYQAEQSEAARNAMAQILANSRMSAMGRRPICQDTGVVNVFIKMGVGARIETQHALQTLVDRAVHQAWLTEANPLRASMVADPIFSRKNTGDNTPANVHVDLVAGDRFRGRWSRQKGRRLGKTRRGSPR